MAAQRRKQDPAALVERLKQTPEGRAKLAAEAERRKAAGPQFTAEMFAGKHVKQLAYLTSTSQYVIACCSRRAGKSFANCALLLLTALATDRVSCVYLGITHDQVRRTVWVRIWKPLLAKYQIQNTSTEDMVTTLANGSVIHFGSLQNERGANTWLGSSLGGGIAILDEVQNAGSDLLEAQERVIEPALTDTTEEHPIPGRLAWSGTFPGAPTGRFWDLYSGDNPAYERHNWNRFDNPYLTNQLENLRKRLARLGISEDEPFIQREEFGRANYGDVGRTAYGFNPEKNLYTPTLAPWDVSELVPFHIMAAIPPPGCDTLAVGIDPAGKTDRYAISAFAWGPGSNRLYHVFEAVTDKGIDSQTLADAVLVFLSRHYPGIYAYVRDHGSAAVLDDSLKMEHGIVVEPAVKAALKARVDRFRALLVDGRAFIMRGSHLATDLSLAMWDSDERGKGRWKWSSACHPDVADSANYLIAKYVDHHEPKPTIATKPGAFMEEIERLADERAELARNNYGYGDPDMFAGGSGYGGPDR